MATIGGLLACQAPRDRVILPVDAAIDPPIDGAIDAPVDAPVDAPLDAAVGTPVDAVVQDATAFDQPPPPNSPMPRPKIVLRYIRNYPSEKPYMFEKGILWCLSMLGARLPPDRRSQLWRWLDGGRFVLDLHAAGFDKHALEALEKLVGKLHASGEFAQHGGIDAGRFVAVTLTSSMHYYAITGAAQTIAAFRQRYLFGKHVAWIVNSLIAVGHRRMEVAETSTFSGIAWLTAEGSGSLPGGTFQVMETEVFDTMPNGQLRFALYGINGELKAAADPSVSKAGRPAKCAFCHEGQVHPTFSSAPFHDKMMSQHRFDTLLNKHNTLIKNYRKGLATLIHYSTVTDHSYLEKQYVAFLEPSKARLAAEWGVDPAQLDDVLLQKPSHTDTRYHVFFSKLYSRDLADSLTPYSVVPVPGDKWHYTEVEPNLL